MARLTGDGRPRCGWAAGDDALMRAYHDHEWGTPTRDERYLFEKLCLEGAQAGLSWRTILHKREAYRRLFAGFDAEKVARFTPARVARLLADPSIVRNRAKIEATIANARATLALREEGGGLAPLLWELAGGVPRHHRYRRYRDAPPATPVSRAMAAELKRRGFRFVGPTTCYAFMQAVGMVNDHELGCYRHAELLAAGDGGQRRPSPRRRS